MQWTYIVEKYVAIKSNEIDVIWKEDQVKWQAR